VIFKTSLVHVMACLALGLAGAGCEKGGAVTEQGATGATGPQGDPGEKGAQGDPGKQGPAGPKGPAGAAGPAGTDGVTGATGPQGAAGAAGPAGPQGLPGMAGAAGPMGPAGAAGAKGATGATGAAGPTGATGAAGPAGAVGPQGPAGAVGAAGANGVTGATGPQGPAGAAGAVGPTGAAGAAGAVGPAGVAGPIGPTGPAGTGSQGPAGPAGTGAYGEDTASFAGFTAFTTGGNLGGRPTAHAACGGAFAGSHLCYVSEYLSARSTTAVPATGAWLDPSISPTGSYDIDGAAPSYGRYVGNTSGGHCSSWTSSLATSYGTFIQANGSASDVGTCNVTRALACCNGPSKITFAGFSTATATMTTGRVGMHALCNAEFPGARICHAAEYLRADSGAAVPAAGAWLDPSIDLNTFYDVAGASPVFGRYTGTQSGGHCSSWTSSLATSYGTVVQANGGISDVATCNVARRVACCQ